MRLGVGLRLTAAATAGVVAMGAWWWIARLAQVPSAWATVGFLLSLLWFALGVAAVGTLASEREPRAAWIVAAIFGGVAVLAGLLGRFL